MQQKIYILDTNVLVHDPEALFSFAQALIGIPAVVLEELDSFKGETTFRGRNAREVIRHLDKLRGFGSLKEGVKLENGGIVQVLFTPLHNELPADFGQFSSDNQILSTMLGLKKEGYEVKLVSKDINMRVKADILGFTAEDYLKDIVSHETFYKGWIKLQVPSIQLKKDMPSELDDLVAQNALVINEFVHLESNNNPYNYRIYRYLGNGKFKTVEAPGFKWPFQARNPEQLMALDLLLDNSVQLVTLEGPAGTGKTFLALLAALHKVLVEDEFEKILVSRPVIPLGPDIGYLPGDVQEKLHSWMQPIYDNMDFIVHSANVSQENDAVPAEEYDRRHKKIKHRREHRNRGMPSLDDLVRSGKISLEAITYMRGRSIPYQYIFIDEVQNLTPHETKTIISRVGEGSKIILAGDPYQIDSPYLDFSSNGLMVTSSKFKGQKLFGTVFLETTERSELSKLAAELL